MVEEEEEGGTMTDLHAHEEAMVDEERTGEGMEDRRGEGRWVGRGRRHEDGKGWKKGEKTDGEGKGREQIRG